MSADDIAFRNMWRPSPNAQYPAWVDRQNDDEFAQRELESREAKSKLSGSEFEPLTDYEAVACANALTDFLIGESKHGQG